jgi:hypothetical protein
VFLATGSVLCSTDRGENWIDYQPGVTDRVERLAALVLDG